MECKYWGINISNNKLNKQLLLGTKVINNYLCCNSLTNKIHYSEINKKLKLKIWHIFKTIIECCFIIFNTPNFLTFQIKTIIMDINYILKQL